MNVEVAKEPETNNDRGFEGSSYFILCCANKHFNLQLLSIYVPDTISRGCVNVNVIYVNVLHSGRCR